MKKDQKSGLAVFLFGLIVGVVIDRFIDFIIGYNTTLDDKWNEAWANSSSPVDLQIKESNPKSSKDKTDEDDSKKTSDDSRTPTTDDSDSKTVHDSDDDGSIADRTADALTK